MRAGKLELQPVGEVNLMMRVTKLKLSILLGFSMCFSSCGLHGNAQQKETPQKQVASSTQQEPEKQETLESKKEWLDYWPADVELERKLSIKTFFGPPNFRREP